MRSGLVRLALAMTGVFFLSASSFSQDSSVDLTKQPANLLKVTTHLVLLDAVVTDKNGNRVADLQPQDFEILEDGVSQNVRYASLHQAGRVAAGLIQSSLPANTFSNRPEFLLTPEAPTVLMLDLLNTPWAEKAAARQKLLDLAKVMPPGRLVAVYLMDNDLHLKRVCDFTSDATTLQTAISGIAPGLNRFVDAPFQSGSRSIARDASGALGEAASQRNGQVVFTTMQGLKALSRTVAGIPGRKNLIWLSANFPFGFDPTLGANRSTGVALSADNIKQVAAVVTDAQMAIYPVNVRGVETTEGSAEPGPEGAMTGERYANRIAAASVAIHASDVAMRSIAEQTGGRAYYGRNDIVQAINDSISDGSSYYILGYYPNNRKWDDKFRKVEVRIKRVGLLVRTHKGYYASDPTASRNAADTQAADKEFLEALQPDMPIASALPFSVEIDPKEQKVHMHYVVDASALPFQTANGENQHISFDFVTSVFRLGGEPVTHASTTMQGTASNATLENIRKFGLRFDHQMAIPAGNYIFRFGVRDNNTGLIGTAEAHLEVPKS